MEETNFSKENFTDEELLQVPEGEYITREDNLNEDILLITTDDRGQNRKASVAMMPEEEEIWRRESENEIWEDINEVHLQVIEKEDYRYIGGVKNDQREGFGVCYYKNGEVFKGQWQNDKREGWGMLTLANCEIIQGELHDDEFSGYVENIFPSFNSSIHGFYKESKFLDNIIVKNGNYIYEGEILKEGSTYSIGKLISIKKLNKIFMGEVKNYKEEDGFGIFINNSTMYLGEIRNKLFENYIEMYNLDGSAYFSIIKNGLKNGYIFSFSKDGRVTFGKYLNNFKNGPFMSFSNCHNLTKSSVRTEIFHLDFKSKVVDKMEHSKKYLMLNYPEWTYIININYTDVINKLNEVVQEEIAYLNSQIPKEDKNE